MATEDALTQGAQAQDARDARERAVLERGGRSPSRTIAYGSHADQVVDLHEPSASGEDGPGVVLVHGGYWKPEWDRGHMAAMADALVDAGCAVAVIEYRRIPGDPDATLDDAASATQAAIDALGDRPVVVAGFSAGGHLALWLAARADLAPRLRRSVALAPVADLAEAERLGLGDDAVLRFLGVPAAQRRDADPVHARPLIEIAIVHGTEDDVVPIALAESYAAAHGLAVERVAGDHVALVEPGSEAWPAVARAILRPPGASATGTMPA